MFEFIIAMLIAAGSAAGLLWFYTAAFLGRFDDGVAPSSSACGCNLPKLKDSDDPPMPTTKPPLADISEISNVKCQIEDLPIGTEYNEPVLDGFGNIVAITNKPIDHRLPIKSGSIGNPA